MTNFRDNRHALLGGVAAVGLLASAMTLPASAATIFGDPNDAQLGGNGTTGFDDANVGPASLIVGRTEDNTNPDIRAAYFIFDLSGVTQTITDATFALTLNSSNFTGSGADPNGDLVGVGYAANATSAGSLVNDNVNGSAEFSAASGDTVIQDNFLIPTSTTGEKTANNAALVNYLNNRTDDFVYFLLFPDVKSSNDPNFYNVAAANTAGTASDPRLDLTLIPEPASLALLGLGGLMLLPRRRR